MRGNAGASDPRRRAGPRRVLARWLRSAIALGPVVEVRRLSRPLVEVRGRPARWSRCEGPWGLSLETSQARESTTSERGLSVVEHMIDTCRR